MSIGSRASLPCANLGRLQGGESVNFPRVSSLSPPPAMKLSRFSYSSVFGATLVVLFSVVLCVSALAKGGKPGGGGGSGGGSTSGEFKPEILYIADGGNGQNLVLANADGTNAKIVYASAGTILRPDFSPTGNVIAFGERVDAGAMAELKTLSYTYDASGITSVTFGPVLDTASSSISSIDISPDGSEVVYKRFNGAAPADLCMISIDGGGRTVLYEENAYTVMEAVWLYDGSGLALSVRDALEVEQSKIVFLPRGAGGISANLEGQPVLWDSENLGPNVYSRGSYLSAARTSKHLLTSIEYRTYDSRGRIIGYNLLARFDLDTAEMTPLAAEGWWACFSSDDTKIIYRGSSERIEVAAIDVVTGDVGTGQVIAPRGALHPDWKPIYAPVP